MRWIHIRRYSPQAPGTELDNAAAQGTILYRHEPFCIASPAKFQQFEEIEKSYHNHGPVESTCTLKRRSGIVEQWDPGHHPLTPFEKPALRNFFEGPGLSRVEITIHHGFLILDLCFEAAPVSRGTIVAIEPSCQELTET